MHENQVQILVDCLRNISRLNNEQTVRRCLLFDKRIGIEDRFFDDLREIVFDFDVFLTFEPSVEPDEEFGGEMKILDETIS